MEPVKGGVMSYMEWEVRQDGTAFDIMNESGAFCTCDNEIDANRIVHCVNNYDGLVEALEKIIRLELAKEKDKKSSSGLQMLIGAIKSTARLAIAKAEEK